MQLPPRTKPKSKSEFRAATWEQLVERHWPKRHPRRRCGADDSLPDGFVVLQDEEQPHLQYFAHAGVKVSGWPLLQPGRRPGVLTFDECRQGADPGDGADRPQGLTRAPSALVVT
jgi:hypothetical protein